MLAEAAHQPSRASAKARGVDSGGRQRSSAQRGAGTALRSLPTSEGGAPRVARLRRMVASIRLPEARPDLERASGTALTSVRRRASHFAHARVIAAMS